MSRKAITLISIFIFTIISCNDSNYVDDKLIFRYNEHANISSLDPAFSSTLRNIGPVNQIFNGLIKLDDSLNISGDLAKKWFISKNGLEYRFVIKKNILAPKSEPDTLEKTLDKKNFEINPIKTTLPHVKSIIGWKPIKKSVIAYAKIIKGRDLPPKKIEVYRVTAITGVKLGGWGTYLKI